MELQPISSNDLINYIVNSQKEKALSINEAYDLFMNYKEVHNRAGTCKSYKETMKNLLSYFENNKIYFTSQITNEVIDKYVAKRVTEVKPITVNKEIVSLNAIMNYHIQNGNINRKRYNFQKLKTTKTKIPMIKKDDIKKILEHFENSAESEKFKLAFELILTTGVRTTELIHIKNKNIDLEKQRILLEFTKNGKQRYIYIIDKLIDRIKNVMSDNKYLFTDDKGQMMSDNSLRLFFKHLKTKLKIEILSPHKLRHYYATNVYEKSKDIHLVSKLLGHCDTVITEVYLDIDEEKNQLCNEQFNPYNFFDL